MSDCIVATKSLDEGYQRARRHGKLERRHRLVLEEKLGRPIRKGYLALRQCNNRSCINPDHLYEGTHADNAKDMVDANRQAKGSRAGSAKLSETQGEEIKRRLHNGEMGRSLAQEFGVNDSQISRIKNSLSWTHVP